MVYTCASRILIIILIRIPNDMLWVRPRCGGLIFSNICVIVIPAVTDIIPMVMDIRSAGTSSMNINSMSFICIWYCPSIIDIITIVVNSSRYWNSRYVLDDGWSMSGRILPNSDTGSDMPINPMNRLIGISRCIIMGISMMVPSMCDNHPY